MDFKALVSVPIPMTVSTESWKNIFAFKGQKPACHWTDVVCQVTHRRAYKMSSYSKTSDFFATLIKLLWPIVLDFRKSQLLMFFPNETILYRKIKLFNFIFFFLHLGETVGRKPQIGMTKHMFLSISEHIFISLKVGHHCFKMNLEVCIKETSTWLKKK